jgi:formiminotetrahydrofolate cyclodeaminase
LNHPASKSLLDLTVGDLLARLGSSDPSPGGGAAAALAGALGAALVQMTANLTIGRPRLADVEDQARSIEHRAGALRQQLAELGDADSAAFDEVSAAYKLPRADDVQKAARTQAIQSALQTAAAVPMQTARICAEVLQVAEEAAPILNPAVISDVVVGALLTQAALESAAINVEINLAAMTNTTTVQRLSSELEQVRSATDGKARRVVETGRSRFPKS